MNLDKALESISKNALPVIYGEGALYRACSLQIGQMLQGKTSLIIDQKFQNTHKFLEGVFFCGPEILSQLPLSTLIVICTRDHFFIAEHLRTLGFNNLSYVQFELSSYRAKQVLAYPKDLSLLSLPIVSFSNKTALVTGSSRGIGLEIAVALAKRGVRVILHAQTADSLKAGLRTFEERASCKAEGVVADFTRDDAPEVLYQCLVDKKITIDILYNNAGVSPLTKNGVKDTDWHSFDESLMVNFRAAVGLTSRLVPQMLNNEFGRIIFVTSQLKDQAERLAYICSKAALASYASELASGLQQTRVRVSTLDPGWILSDMGGADAPNQLESVIPGALVGALSLPIENGIWVSAQDYSQLNDGQLMRKVIMDGFLKNEST